MTVYVIALFALIDRGAYDLCRRRFMEVFVRHKGRLLVSDERPTVVESAWDYEKVALLSFPDEAAYR